MNNEILLILLIIAFLLLILTLVILLITKKRKKGKEKDEAPKEEIIRNNLEILPIRHYDEEIGAFCLSDGTYLDLFEIVPKDRENLQDDVVRYDIYTFTKFEKLYSLPHKDIGINFPLDTHSQRRNLAIRKKRTADPVRRMWLDREIEELEKIESMVKRKEFYRFYYAENKNELLKNRRNLEAWLGSGRNKTIAEIPKEKKFQIIRKLCNMNTLVTANELTEVNYEE